MLTPERRHEIEQEIRTRRVARAACIAAGLPPDSPEPEEEEEEEPGEEDEEEMAPMEVEEAEGPEQQEPEQQLPCFDMAQAEAAYTAKSCREAEESLKALQEEQAAAMSWLRQQEEASRYRDF